MRRRAVERPAIEPHYPGFVAERAANAIDKGALAGPVRSDQAQALAGAHRQRNAVECYKAAEALTQTVDVENSSSCRTFGGVDADVTAADQFVGLVLQVFMH